MNVEKGQSSKQCHVCRAEHIMPEMSEDRRAEAKEDHKEQRGAQRECEEERDRRCLEQGTASAP